MNTPFITLWLQIGLLKLSDEALAFNIGWIVLLLGTYWLILIKVRRPDRVTLWLKQQLDDPVKQRVSAGVGIVLLDEFHIFAFFGSWFVFLANFMHMLGSRDILSYAKSLYYIALASHLLSGFDIPSDPPLTIAGVLICSIASILGLIFAALVTTTFFRVYSKVFK